MDSSSLTVAVSPISFARLECASALKDLQVEVSGLLSGRWVDHVNRNDYLGEWDVLPLRCNAEHVDAHPILQGFALECGEHWINLPVLAHCPGLTAVIDNLQCPVKAARLMRLKAGAHIKPHRDPELGLDYGEARLHLPIFTSSDIIFWVDNKRVPMAAGELWYINADQIHEVRNPGIEDRINLVIDCVANDWLRNAIRRTAP